MSEVVLKRARNCSTKKETKAPVKASKRICVPIDQEEYQRIVLDPNAFRQFLDPLLDQYPEVFPEAMGQGYTFHDILPASLKLPGLRLRRIKVVSPDSSTETVFTIAPSFVWPYMTGYTDEVEKALFLRGKFGVPYWGLTYVFGHNDMYWARLELSLGRNSIVGTTVKDADKLPRNLLADEKHTWLNGERAYVATTVGAECILGASLALRADEKELTEAYQFFKTEAQNVAPQYQPETVNTDGWAATQAAWRTLFASITLIACFLHAFLKIRDRCQRLPQHFTEICQRVWEAYHAPTALQFRQKCDALKHWATVTLAPGPGLNAILKLCERVPLFALAYDHPAAHRTSNMLDRLMDHMDRRFYAAHYFHGHLLTAEYAVRAQALLANFLPYCPRATVTKQYLSPTHQLNGFVYHDNWLHNLLVSASMGGFRQ